MFGNQSRRTELKTWGGLFGDLMTHYVSIVSKKCGWFYTSLHFYNQICTGILVVQPKKKKKKTELLNIHTSKDDLRIHHIHAHTFADR